MVRPWSVLCALTTVATALGLTILTGPATLAAPRTAHVPEALAVTIDTLAPSAVPRRGPLRITGVVTNKSADQWRAINVYALTGTEPITTPAALEEATGTDPDMPVGARITEPGTYDTIDVLEPGESAPYSLRVPRRDILIGDAPGVYWLGVHVLGETDEGRDDPADGKARTFWPLLPTGSAPIDVALVLPMRRALLYDADGRVSDAGSWTADLAPGGRLGQLTDLAQAAGSRPLTWVIDPAVPAAVDQIADGNPQRSLEPTLEPDDPGTGTGTADPSGDASTAGGDGADEDGTGEAAAETTQPDGRAVPGVASVWLNRTGRALAGDQILLLPYGDLDVAAAAEQEPSRYAMARNRAGRTIPELGLTGSPAVAPPSGYVDAEALGLLPDNTTVLVSNQMVPTVDGPVATVEDRTLAVARSEALRGGPGPGRRRRPVDLRQRILSEATLAGLSGQSSLIASFPMALSPEMNPATAAEFFAGFDLDGIRLRRLRHVLVRAESTTVQTPQVDTEDLVYPRLQVRRALPAVNFASAQALTDAGRSLDGMLPLNDQVGRTVTGESMSALSYSMRQLASTARLHADQSRVWIERRLQAVTIASPPSVTLSGTSGPFSATVTNELDQPVRVKVAAVTDSGLQIADSEVLELSPQERGTATMEASSTDPSAVGVHGVTLQVVDDSGRPLGGSATFPLRVARVSDVIWVVIAVGAALLLAAIVARLYRRIRAWLRTRGPTA